MSEVQAVGVQFPPITRKIGGIHILDLAPVVVIARQDLSQIGRDLSEGGGAGYGQLQAGGGARAAVAVMDAVKEHGSEPEKSFPIGHAIFAIDVSGSMAWASGDAAGNLKLTHFTQLIQTLAKSGIPDDTPLTLIIFDAVAKTVIRHTTNKEQFFETIKRISTGGGTNILAAFKEASINVKAFENNSSDPDRVFFLLGTDGDHNTPNIFTDELFTEAEKLALLNCGAYIVGIGTDYSKIVIPELASRMGYAGWCHTPPDKSGINVIAQNVPGFMEQMTSIKHYMTVLAEGFSGNADNRLFFNLNPVITRARYQRTGSDWLNSPHYEVRTGFQRDSLSIGFAPDLDLDKGRAKLYFCLQRHANSKLTFEREEISIYRIEDLPSYGLFEEGEEARRLIERIKRIPLELENCLCQQEEDPKAFDELIKRNPGFMDPAQSAVISRNLRKQNRTDPDDENSLRGSFSDSASRLGHETITDFREHTRTVSNQPRSHIPKGHTDDGHSSPLHSNLDEAGSPPQDTGNQSQGGQGFDPQHSGAFLGPLDLRPIAVDSQGNVPLFQGGNVTGYNEAGPIANGDPNTSQHPITYSSDGKFGIQVLKGKVNLTSALVNKNQITIGRSPDNDIVIDTGAVSRIHCTIRKDAIGYYIEDHNSRNGTYVNEKRINGRVKLNNGDQVKICDLQFIVHIKVLPSSLKPNL